MAGAELGGNKKKKKGKELPTTFKVELQFFDVLPNGKYVNYF